ncbi:glycosyltransferase [Yersinia alsatica]|uniref:Glycosyltransferase n=1 Tax=Yersinia alsatica TaxID=2890317 RepID=A0ABY5UPU1_9GAMM|nr:glycosyltransferase [Yersinia alsatica]OVZ93496.1 glycosyl transferase [Yersinia frederiksenii]OWF69295.1 glycosyl transferase [Yersinia frederiksenii]UWM45506.1 glycosyltransferase [Yersinia alsatica]CNL52225.1 putative glycosyl transferase [Yersinia frederiksenii]CNL67562.1 putative glycosyl transferase [Yersinia frederiksenii]
MSKKDISVVVPIFNCMAYLAELLNSLRNQSGPSLEIIAVNDGSTDNSLSILENIARRDRRIIIVNQHNQGLSVARNTGIARASGTWVAFADGDDWLAPNALSTWLDQAQQQQLDVLIGNGYAFNAAPQQAKRSPLLHKQPWNQVLSGKQWIIRSVEHHEWPHYAWLQLIRRDLLNTHQLAFIPGMLHEDILWTAQLALAAQRVGYCANPFYGYRTNPESITHSPATQALLHRANSYIHIIKGLVDIAETVEPTLRHALFRHANQESRHFLGLMRKRLQVSSARSALAAKFGHLGLHSALFRGIGNIHELWLALRCSLIILRYARQKHSLPK